jgi:hypothetical protein
MMNLKNVYEELSENVKLNSVFIGPGLGALIADASNTRQHFAYLIRRGRSFFFRIKVKLKVTRKNNLSLCKSTRFTNDIIFRDIERKTISENFITVHYIGKYREQVRPE